MRRHASPATQPCGLTALQHDSSELCTPPSAARRCPGLWRAYYGKVHQLPRRYDRHPARLRRHRDHLVDPEPHLMADYFYTIACYLSTEWEVAPGLLQDQRPTKPSIVDGEYQLADVQAR